MSSYDHFLNFPFVQFELCDPFIDSSESRYVDKTRHAQSALLSSVSRFKLQLSNHSTFTGDCDSQCGMACTFAVD